MGKAEEIINHNQKIRGEIESLRKLIDEKQKQIIPPCEFCPYDGVFRCEACAEENYIGYNVKDYPK